MIVWLVGWLIVRLMGRLTGLSLFLKVKAPNCRGSVMFSRGNLRTGPVALMKVIGKVKGIEHWGPTKNINTAMYEDLLTLRLLPYLEQHAGALFQQDGAPIHESKAMRDSFKRYGISLPLWPPKSPDLSVFENIWSLIKAQLALFCVTMLADIEILVPQIWNDLVKQEYC